MKNIITLFCIVLLVNTKVFSQELINNTRFFKTINSYKWNYVDTLKIISKTADTTNFEIGRVQMIKRGNLIYKTSEDSALLYNYSLEAGDTFILNLNFQPDQSFIVDSIKNRLLKDGKFYKHWYLHNIEEPVFKIIWVQNLGEKTLGWDWTYFNNSHYPGVYGICANYSLIYWGFEDNNNKTCNFDSLAFALKIEGNYIHSNLNFFPNPVQNIVQWNSDEEFEFSVYSSDGKLCLEGKASGQIDLSSLTIGMYQLVLKGKNSFHQTLILKE